MLQQEVQSHIVWDKEQTVNNDSGWLVFNELEIINENGGSLLGLLQLI